MRLALICGLSAVLALALFCTVGSAHDAKTKNPNLGKLRHVVLFKFKDDTAAKDVKAIEKGFAELPKKIDTIVDFEWGTDVSVENLQQGFTHCFVVTFNDAKGREVYLPHPAHKAFVKMLKPHLDKVLVIDFVAK